ncbi:MAG TPA: histidine kinase dimerization/phospho-acceptor domain-containing protein, partial [Vicinamibacterales bacterium]|nr:histidine kinase dimerization/phospho-acceptor domain-containing protein [Vicinamibacterales bacterium]
MTDRLGQRLARTFGALVAFTIIGIGILVSAIVYGIQVRSLSDACEGTIRIVDDLLVVYPASQRDARSTLDVLMTHLSPSNLLIVVSDGRTRYEGRWVEARGESNGGYAVTVSSRNAFPEPSQSAPFVERATRSVAALVGYKGSSTRADDSTVIVMADALVLKTISWHSLLVLAGFIIFALFIGYALGKAMSHQALEPMVMVSEALEAFAAGDLSPRPVRTRRGERDELDRLALGYNAAMATMGRAFAERARAETAMRQFIADASHQLRTPLTVLRGFTGILRRREFDTDEEFARIVDTMDGQSAIMTSLLQKLLLLESWESVPPEGRDVIDVAEVVERVVAPIAAS